MHKIKDIREGKIIGVFNDGYQIVDVPYLLIQEEYQPGMLGYELIEDPELVEGADLEDGALTWRLISRF